MKGTILLSHSDKNETCGGMQAAFSDTDEDQYRGPRGHTPPTPTHEDLEGEPLPQWFQ
ncbi:MAG: hypothetical protein KBB54_02415 [Candidatus Pacebacteria bacterium]|nr:hypothetical protein [Candidatus Paceibacterota bacterium]